MPVSRTSSGSRQWRTVLRSFAGLATGFLFGGLANYFILLVLLQRNAEWRITLFAEAGLALVLGAIVIRSLRQRGFGFTPALLLGVTLSIVAIWLLLFWVVI
jgi:hypothetical protein